MAEPAGFDPTPLLAEHAEVEAALSDPAVHADPARARRCRAATATATNWSYRRQMPHWTK